MTGDEGDHQRRVTVFLGNICLGRGPDSCLRNGCLNMPEAVIGYRLPSRLAGRVRVPVSMHFTGCPEHQKGLSFKINASPAGEGAVEKLGFRYDDRLDEGA